MYEAEMILANYETDFAVYENLITDTICNLIMVSPGALLTMYVGFPVLEQ